MKSKMFFLVVFCTAFAACSSNVENDNMPSLPTTSPVMLEVVSYNFVKEDVDVLKPVQEPAQVLRTINNMKDDFSILNYEWRDVVKDSSLLLLTEGKLPDESNLEELLICVPQFDASGLISYDQLSSPLIFGSTLKLDRGSKSLEKISGIVPAYTTYELIGQRYGYECTMTFYLVLKDANTNQMYNLKGKWKGVQLMNGTLTLSELQSSKD